MLSRLGLKSISNAVGLSPSWQSPSYPVPSAVFVRRHPSSPVTVHIPLCCHHLSRPKPAPMCRSMQLKVTGVIRTQTGVLPWPMTPVSSIPSRTQHPVTQWMKTTLFIMIRVSLTVTNTALRPSCIGPHCQVLQTHRIRHGSNHMSPCWNQNSHMSRCCSPRYQSPCCSCCRRLRQSCTFLVLRHPQM